MANYFVEKYGYLEDPPYEEERASDLLLEEEPPAADGTGAGNYFLDKYGVLDTAPEEPEAVAAPEEGPGLASRFADQLASPAVNPIGAALLQGSTPSGEYTEGRAEQIEATGRQTLGSFAEMAASPLRSFYDAMLRSADPGSMSDELRESLSSPMGLERFAKDQFQKAADLRESAREKTPDEPVPKFMTEALDAVVEMAPSVGVSYLTKKPSAALATMGTTVFGRSYGQARQEGKDPDEALTDAGIALLTELGPEKAVAFFDNLVLGKSVTNLLKSAAREAASEAITEELQIEDEIFRQGKTDITAMEAFSRIFRAAGMGAVIGVPAAVPSMFGKAEDAQDTPDTPDGPDGRLPDESPTDRAKREQDELESAIEENESVVVAGETQSLEALQAEARQRAARAGGDALDQELAAAEVALDLSEEMAAAAEGRRTFFNRERELAKQRVEAAKVEEQKAKASEKQETERQKVERGAQPREDLPNKAVDDNGQPVVVYRGEHGLADTTFHTRSGSLTFTDSAEAASKYAQSPNDQRETPAAPRVHRVALNISNPVINTPEDPFIDGKQLREALGLERAIEIMIANEEAIYDTNRWDEVSDGSETVRELLDRRPATVDKLYFKAFYALDDAEVVADLKAAGYDGAIYGGSGETARNTEYRVFDESQIVTPQGDIEGQAPEVATQGEITGQTPGEVATQGEIAQAGVQETAASNNIEQAETVDVATLPEAEANAAVLEAANQAASSPTNTLKEPRKGSPETAYPVGEVTVQGMNLEIENAPGTERNGRLMTQPYGRVKDVKGADGDLLDVFVGPKPNSPNVYVIDQVDQNGQFDEHKVMVGYPNQLAAVRAYKSNYDEGHAVGPVTEMTVDEFKALTASGALRSPVSPQLQEPRGRDGLKAKRARQGVSMRLERRKGVRRGKPMTKAEAQERVGYLIRDGHALKPHTNVVESARNLPEELLQRLPATQKRLLFQRRVPGFIDTTNGQIYIIADANRSTEMLLETVLHEGIGHMGVALFNVGQKKLSPSAIHKEIFDSITKSDNALMNQIVETYGLDLTNAVDQEIAGDEYIAHLAENPGADPTVWRKIVDRVREFLRDTGMVKEWTDNDIRQMLRRSADYLQRERPVEHAKLVGLNRGIIGPEALAMKKVVKEPYVPSPEQTDIPNLLIGEVEQSLVDVFERAKKADAPVTGRRLKQALGAPVDANANDLFERNPTSYDELNRMVAWAMENKKDSKNWYDQFARGIQSIVGRANMNEASFLFGMTSPQAPPTENLANTLLIMSTARMHNPVTDTRNFVRTMKAYRNSTEQQGWGLSNAQIQKVVHFYKTGEYSSGYMKAITYGNTVLSKSKNRFHPYGVMDRHMGRAFGFAKSTFNDKQYRYMNYLTAKLALDNNMRVEEVQAAIWAYAKEHMGSRAAGGGTWAEAKAHAEKAINTIEEMAKNGRFNRFKPFSKEVESEPLAKFEVQGSPNKPRISDPYSNYKHMALIEDVARARAPSVLISLEPGHARGYGFPEEMSFRDRELYRDEALARMTDADGQIPLLRELGLPHEIIPTTGTWEGKIEPSMEIKFPGGSLADVNSVAHVLGHAFLQDATYTIKPKWGGQDFVAVVTKKDGTDFTHDEIAAMAELKDMDFTAIDNSGALKFMDGRRFELEDAYTAADFQAFTDKLTTFFGEDTYEIGYSNQEGGYFDTSRGPENLEQLRDQARAKGSPDLQRTGIDPLYESVWEAYRKFSQDRGLTPKNTEAPVDGLPKFSEPAKDPAPPPAPDIQMRILPSRRRAPGPRQPWQRPKKSVLEHMKKTWDKWMKAGGNLPDRVFARKIERDSEMRVEEMHIRHLLTDLDRAIKKAFGKSHYGLEDAIKVRINDYLAGNTQVMLPAEVKAAADKMRAYLDRLSGMMIQSGVIENAETVDKVLDNIGKYLNRSYRAFDDPRWAKDVPDDVRRDAYRYLEQRLRDEGALDGLTQRQIENRVNGIINNILEAGTAADKKSSLISEWVLGQKDLSILMRRKDIAEPIRRLLGEYQDPRVNFTRSAIKMERAIMNHEFLKTVFVEGKDVFLFDKPTGAFSVPLEGASEKTFGPLQGMYTSPEIRDAFRHILDKNNLNVFWRHLIGWNGMVKYGKTVLSLTTISRNFLSASFFSIANGHFWMFHPKEMKKAFMNVQRDLRSRSSSRTYMKKMIELGVVYDNPHAGELIGVLKDFTQNEGAFAQNMISGKARSFFDIMTRIYQAGDDFWKIIGFEIESARLEPEMGRANAETTAAQRIRDTYPTYSMVGRAIKWLRKFPLMGTFVSFPAEIVRTSVNIMRYTAQDIAAGRTKAAWQRSVGIALAAGSAAALRAISMAIVGLDDEDDEAIRMMGPPWSRNSDLYYSGFDENGLPEYFDLSFLDPYNYLKRPINAMVRGTGDWKEQFASALKDMTDPFFGRDIAFGAILDVVNNKKETGGQVYNPEDTVVQQQIAIWDHVRKAVQPGTFGNLERIAKAAMDDTSRYGKQYKLEDELWAIGGFRKSTLNPLQSISFKAYEFGQRKQDAVRILSYVVGGQNQVSEDEIRSAFGRMLDARQDAYEDMIQYVETAQGMGLPTTSIFKILKASGASQKDAASIVKGIVPKWTPSSSFMKSARDRAIETSVSEEQKVEVLEQMRERLSIIDRLFREQFTDES